MIQGLRLSRKRLVSLSLLLLVAALLATGEARLAKLASWGSDRLAAVQCELGLAVVGVEITGRRLTPTAVVAAAIGPVEGRLLGGLDLSAIRARLEAISWIAEAEVLRAWPDRLQVSLVERKPFALWSAGGKLALVDAHGVELTGEGLARWRHFPLLVGERAPQAAPAMLALLAETPELADRVAALLRIGGRRWDVEIDNGIRIKLPAADPHHDDAYGPAAAWRRFAALERRHRLLARAISVVDLRLDDRLTLRLSPDGRSLGLAAREEASI